MSMDYGLNPSKAIAEYPASVTGRRDWSAHAAQASKPAAANSPSPAASSTANPSFASQVEPPATPAAQQAASSETSHSVNPSKAIAEYPTTVTGKRDWSWHAVHGDVPVPSKDTVPEVEAGFADLIDVINPLQHIPIVSNIYRAMTGDTIKPAASIMGDTLFGGPIGFLGGVGSTLIAQTTGNDVSGHILASIFGSKDDVESTTSALRASAQYDAASRLRF